MKKILCIILVFLLFLVSCKKSTSISPVITDISFTAEASINNEISKYETVIKYKDDNILIELSDLSSGITFSFYDGKLTEKLYNIENKTDISSLSALSVPELIYFIINDITQNNKLIKSDDNFFYIESDTDKYDYKIFFAESGIPLKIEENNLSVKILIKNARLL